MGVVPQAAVLASGLATNYVIPLPSLREALHNPFVVRNTHIMPQGGKCVWPRLPRCNSGLPAVRRR